jgi:hypothetical protein
VARAGAARIEQEGTANAFAAAARATGSGSILAPLQQFAARRGFLGRDVMAAMAVLDAASRAAAVETVQGTKPVATLSPLARTLLWANDMNDALLDIAEAIDRDSELRAVLAESLNLGPRDRISNGLVDVDGTVNPGFGVAPVVVARANAAAVPDDRITDFCPIYQWLQPRIEAFPVELTQEMGGVEAADPAIAARQQATVFWNLVWRTVAAIEEMQRVRLDPASVVHTLTLGVPNPIMTKGAKEIAKSCA